MTISIRSRRSHQAIDIHFYMIFNTFAYYLLFLVPAATLFRLTSSTIRPLVCIFGISFFVYFSLSSQ